MDDTPPAERDPVECFLEARFPAESAASLRPALQLRTTRLVHRRRRWRQLGLLAALAGCYLAGLATMRVGAVWQGDRVATGTEQTAARTSEETETLPAAATIAPPPIDQDPEVSARLLERMASASQEQRASLYRVAGDRYLEVDGDLVSALRCYRCALRELREGDLVISAGDNWLLLALKKARLEEKKYAKHAG
jgi:hypothetical protein